MGRAIKVGISLVFGFMAGLLFGCSTPAGDGASKGLNVVLITLDTVRADHLGCYGSEVAQTSNLDRLAASGILFENAFCQVPITLPSHASILTGLQPPHHGVRVNATQRLPSEVDTLAEILKSEGYATAAFVSAFVLNSQFGTGQGFDHYDDRMTAGGKTIIAERPAKETARLAAEWLSAAPSSPFFLWVHFFDAHRPYAPPSPYLEEFEGRPYDGEIAFMDEGVGTVLDALERAGFASRTIVVAVADHGEGLGEHMEKTHALFVYDTTIRVPLLVRVPGEATVRSEVPPAGSRDSRIVQTVDIMSTVLALAGHESPAGLDGINLFDSQPVEVDRVAYAESLYPLSFRWSPLRSLRTAEFKFIEAPRGELYRWQADPGETDNLAALETGVSEEFAGLLAELAFAERRPEESHSPLEEEDRAALESLGYFSGSRLSRIPDEIAALPDPKDHAVDFDIINQAREELHAGNHAEAISMLSEVAERDPDDPVVHGLLGSAYVQSEEWGQGIRHLCKQMELAPDDAEGAYLLGVGYIRSGSPDSAVAPLHRAVDLLPSYAAAWDQLGVAHGMSGRYPEALGAASEATRWEPENPDYRKNLGVTLLRLGQSARAAQAFREALALRPDDVDLARHLRLATGQVGKDQSE